VILLATSVPARAASLPADQGVTITSLTATFQEGHWNGTDGQMVPAVMAQANVQNAPAPAPDPTAIITLRITYRIPVGAIVDPAWGLGQFGPTNTEGIEVGAPWVLNGAVTVTADVATLIFDYTGSPIPQYSTVQPTVWVQTASSQVAALATVSVLATHLNGDVSTDLATDVTALVADDPPGGPP